ncbi:hypothetical protein F220043C3_13010 [Enterocloster asparagiformis]
MARWVPQGRGLPENPVVLWGRLGPLGPEGRDNLWVRWDPAVRGSLWGPWALGDRSVRGYNNNYNLWGHIRLLRGICTRQMPLRQDCSLQVYFRNLIHLDNYKTY